MVVALLAILGASFCAVSPWFHYGIPSGHDFEFHFNSWVEVLAHWRQGVFYPHWAAWAHYGYGEARFIFYPPISWMLGGALSAILPWKVVPGTYVWLALTLAGLSMYVVARRWMSPSAALFAAIFYALNPYHLVIVYWRSAYAELLAAAYLPLLLYFLIRLEADGKRMIAPTAVLLAAGWLTNVPSAVMMHYALAVLAVWISISHRRWQVLFYAGITVVAGAALAGVYLVPVFHQKSWVSLDQVLSPGVRPEENFLFAHTSDAEHDSFNRLISVVAVTECAVLAGGLLLWRVKKISRLWSALVLWGAFSALLTLQFTSPLWRFLPQLRYVQFPWRWLLVLNLALAVTLALTFRSAWLRAAACVLGIALVFTAGKQILTPWWDNTGDLWQMIDDQHDRIGNEGVDEYEPAAVDPDQVDQNGPLAKYEGAGSANILVQRWDAERRIILANSQSPGILDLRLFNYPLWQVKINGSTLSAGTGSRGEMTIPVRSGKNRIEVRFVEGWDRPVGASISLITLLLLGIFHRRQRTPALHGDPQPLPEGLQP